MRFLFFAAAFAGLLGCASPAEVYGQHDPQANLAALEARILVLAAEARQTAGLSPALRLDPALAAIAQAHAEDMARRGYFDHVDPEGNNVLRRVFRSDPGFQGAVGENIATQGFAPGAGFDPQAFATLIVGAWLKSPGHKMTLLSPLFHETGLGVAMSRDAVFVTQVFAGPVPGLGKAAVRLAPAAAGEQR